MALVIVVIVVVSCMMMLCDAEITVPITTKRTSTKTAMRQCG